MSSSSGDWAETFAGIARDLLDEPDVDRTLDRVVQLAVETVQGCEEAGISLTRRGRGDQTVDTPASTGHAVRRAHEMQGELGEGPCLDAIWEHETFQVDDLAVEGRWPRWAPAVSEQFGFASILSLRLYTGEGTLGSLNLYSRRSAAFNDDARQVGLTLAAHAAVAFTGARDRADLARAADTRLVIGQAEGILMERLGVDADRAFEVLRRASNDRNLKLRDVARQVVETRETSRGGRGAHG